MNTNTHLEYTGQIEASSSIQIQFVATRHECRVVMFDKNADDCWAKTYANFAMVFIAVGMLLASETAREEFKNA